MTPAEAIKIAAGLYLSSEGAVLPITTWFDASGDECGPLEAVACVAGEGDGWFALDLADFAEVPIQ